MDSQDLVTDSEGDVSSKNESERDSPIIKQSGTTQKRSTQRQSHKRSRSDSNSRSRSVSDENNNTNTSGSSTSTPKPGRKRTSIIWNHCTEKLIRIFSGFSGLFHPK